MPFRQYILAAVDHVDSQNVFEIGCGSGPNLRLLQAQRPDITIAGMDSDPFLAAHAEQRLGVKIHAAKVPDFMPQACHTVLTCYSLAYVHPDRLPVVFSGLAGNYITILMEPSAVGQPEAEITGKRYWIHDYKARFEPDFELVQEWDIPAPVDSLNKLYILKSRPYEQALISLSER
jgi:hypothetical protein